MPVALRVTHRGALRHSRLDAVLIAASMAHAALLVLLPSAPVVALGMRWNANTVAHNFIHRPFFRRASYNRAYSLFLSAVLGFPQSVWRERHLAHHADRPIQLKRTQAVAEETTVVLAVWAAWFALSAGAFLFAYVPGWIGGMLLCRLQGHFEHARGPTSHYGRVYNLLFCPPCCSPRCSSGTTWRWACCLGIGTLADARRRRIDRLLGDRAVGSAERGRRPHVILAADTQHAAGRRRCSLGFDPLVPHTGQCDGGCGRSALCRRAAPHSHIHAHSPRRHSPWRFRGRWSRCTSTPEASSGTRSPSSSERRSTGSPRRRPTATHSGAEPAPALRP